MGNEHKNYKKSLKISNLIWEIIAVAFILLIVISSSLGVVLRIKDRARTDIKKYLTTALEISHTGIRKMHGNQKKAVKLWARNTQIQRCCGAAYKITPNSRCSNKQSGPERS